MKLIVGLGNPGEKYQKTRHNVGFRFLDFLRERIEAPTFHMEKKLESELSLKQPLILARPQTFMNHSGQAVAKLLAYYKVKHKDLIVIHDDAALVFGKIKMVEERGSAGHHGIESLFQHLGSRSFIRVRVGIRPDESKAKSETFVLKNFSKEEAKHLPEIFEQIQKTIQDQS